MRILNTLLWSIIYFLSHNLRAPVECTPSDPGATSVDSNSTSTTATTEGNTTLKQIELDLKDTKSKENFDCLKADGNARYTAKTGYGFSSVRRSSGRCGGSDVDFWEADDLKIYASEVYRDGTGTFSSMNNVTIFFPNNTYKRFTKVNKKWVQLNAIKFLSQDRDNQELGEDDYNVTENENRRFFHLQDGSKCSEVIYIDMKPDPNKRTKLVPSDLTIWKHDSAKHSHKYPIHFSYYCPDKFVVNFDDMFSILNRKNEGKWEETKSFDFQMFGNKSEGSHKVLYGKNYELTEEGDEHHFKFNTDVKCSQLNHKGSELWKHVSDKYGDKFPLLLRYKNDRSRLLMDFEGFFVLCLKDGDKLKAHDLFIKLYTKTADGNLREIDHPEFTLKEDSDVFNFLFDKEVVCDAVKYKGESVWMFDEQKHGKENPHMLTYKKDGSMLSLEFENVFTRFEKKQGGEFERVDFDIKFYTRDPSDNTLELNASNYDLSEDGDDYVFKFKQGVKCSEIKILGNTLWIHDSNKYGDTFPNFVKYKKDGARLLVNFEGGFIFYRKDDDEHANWDDGVQISLRLFAEDPNDSTKLLELGASVYELSQHFDGYEFKLNEDAKCTLAKLDGVEVWKHDPSKHEGKHPVLIRYRWDRTKLLVHFVDTFLLYDKDDDGNWTHKEALTLDISLAASELFEFSKTKYFQTFEAKPGYIITAVKLGDLTIFEPVDLFDCGNKVSVHKTLDAEPDGVFVFLGDGNVKRVNKLYDPDQWILDMSPLSLDINNKRGTFYYNYNNFNNEFERFATTDSFVMKRVRYGLEKLWESDAPMLYCFKLDLFTLKKSKKLNIYLSNGETKVITLKEPEIKPPAPAEPAESPEAKPEFDVPLVKPPIPPTPVGRILPPTVSYSYLYYQQGHDFVRPEEYYTVKELFDADYYSKVFSIPAAKNEEADASVSTDDSGPAATSDESESTLTTAEEDVVVTTDGSDADSPDPLTSPEAEQSQHTQDSDADADADDGQASTMASAVYP